MTRLLMFFIIASTLAPLSFASDHVVLFSEDGVELKFEYGNISTSKVLLKLDFYEDCIDNSPNVCSRKQQGNDESYLRFFSKSETPECIDFNQIAQSMNDVLQFCVDMANSSWFGGAERTVQEWPLNKLQWTNVSYVTKEENSQAVLESYFFNSDGFYIHIDESVALFVDINGPRPGKMCFAAKVIKPYRKPSNAMRFRACKYGNPREAHERAVKDLLGMPEAVPNTYAVKYPIWSTWARYKVDVNTDKVYKYAKEIEENGYPKGTLEIDDNWETCYGSAEFNTSRFKNITKLIADLKSMGFKTSLWAHPFVNLECEKHKVGVANGYFVKTLTGAVNTIWWNGEASYVDFTNPEAAAWWSNDLRVLLATSGIDTLKFDAGESSWSPQLPEFHDKDLTNYPDNIVNAYLKTITAFGDGIEYRVSRRSQRFGRFLRMMDRESRWDYILGLPTLITSLIHLNMVGYPFVLPDMIGGNGYNNQPPTKEMYIRWLEANVFMPVVQFSYTPWDFDQQTVDICKRLMDLRSKHTDTIIELMRNSVVKGSPVNPPVWWIDPTDPVAHSISDEFLLGENILVAPVIVENAKSRDVYLPAGLWRDENHPESPLIRGRTWLYNYTAEIEVLPWFTKVGDAPKTSDSIGPTSYNVYVLTTALCVYLFQ